MRPPRSAARLVAARACATPTEGPRAATSARPSPPRCEESGPVLTGPAAVDIAAVVVDVAPQLPALLGGHARVAVRVAVRGVARRHLLGRGRASRRAAPRAAVALSLLLRRRRKRGEQNQDNTH